MDENIKKYNDRLLYSYLSIYKTVYFLQKINKFLKKRPYINIYIK